MIPTTKKSLNYLSEPLPERKGKSLAKAYTLFLFSMAIVYILFSSNLQANAPKIISFSPTFGYYGTKVTLKARGISENNQSLELYMDKEKIEIESIKKYDMNVFVSFKVPEGNNGGVITLVSNEGKTYSKAGFFMLSPHLSIDGVLFMIFGWSVVFSLTVYCFVKVLRTGVDLENNN